MIVELGHLALILAFLVAVVQMVVPMVGAHRGWADWMRLAVPAAVVQFLLTLAAFVALMWAFAVSDFSVRLVAMNSHSAKPMIYKVGRHLGQPRGLDAALDADPDALRRHGRLVGAATCRRR